MKSPQWVLAVLAASWCSATHGSRMLSRSELNAMLQSERPPVVLDLRSKALFAQGSLPGAINIPIQFLTTREFPNLSALVLVEDGRGAINAAEAAHALAQRVDFPVYRLTGGYAGWIEQGGADSRPSGLQPESLPRLTYRQLLETDLANVVLYDLRQLDGELNTLAPASLDTDDPVVRFAAEKGVTLRAVNPVTQLAGKAMQPMSGSSGGVAVSQLPPIVVLIDNNDGTAEQTARVLRANGLQRVVILTGGAEVIRHQGRPGRSRQSTGIVIESVSEEDIPHP